MSRVIYDDLGNFGSLGSKAEAVTDEDLHIFRSNLDKFLMSNMTNGVYLEHGQHTGTLGILNGTALESIQTDEVFAHEVSEFSKIREQIRSQLDHLEKTGGTSSVFALGYQDYLPEHIQLESFTTHTSKTNYAISCESLRGALLLVTVAGLIAGLGYMAYRMLVLSKGDSAPKAVKAVKALPEAQKVLKQVSKNAERVQRSTTQQWKDKVCELTRARLSADLTAGLSDEAILEDLTDLFLRDQISDIDSVTLGFITGTYEPVIGETMASLDAAQKVLDLFSGKVLSLLEFRLENPNGAEVTKAVIDELVTSSMGSELDAFRLRTNEFSKTLVASVIKDTGYQPDRPAYHYIDEAHDVLAAKPGLAITSKLKVGELAVIEMPRVEVYETMYRRLGALRRNSKDIEKNSRRLTKNTKIAGDANDALNALVEEMTNAVKFFESLKKMTDVELRGAAMATKHMGFAAKRAYELMLEATESLGQGAEADSIRTQVEDGLTGIKKSFSLEDSAGKVVTKLEAWDPGTLITIGVLALGIISGLAAMIRAFVNREVKEPDEKLQDKVKKFSQNSADMETMLRRQAQMHDRLARDFNMSFEKMAANRKVQAEKLSAAAEEGVAGVARMKLEDRQGNRLTALIMAGKYNYLASQIGPDYLKEISEIDKELQGEVLRAAQTVATLGEDATLEEFLDKAKLKEQETASAVDWFDDVLRWSKDMLKLTDKEADTLGSVYTGFRQTMLSVLDSAEIKRILPNVDSSKLISDFGALEMMTKVNHARRGIARSLKALQNIQDKMSRKDTDVSRAISSALKKRFQQVKADVEFVDVVLKIMNAEVTASNMAAYIVGRDIPNACKEIDIIHAEWLNIDGHVNNQAMKDGLDELKRNEEKLKEFFG